MPPPVRAVNDYGLDAELAAKANAKYDVRREREAQQWIEQTTGVRFNKPFGEMLRDGAILCKLVNRLRPNSVPVYEGSQAFKQMENVSNFIGAARRMGVPESDLFTTVALYEHKDLGQVVLAVLALKRVAERGRGRAPGKAPAPRIARTDASVSRLNNGSHGFMESTVNRRPVMETNRAEYAGNEHIPDASVSRLNNGSHGFMESVLSREPVVGPLRARFAGGYNPNASVSKLSQGSHGVMESTVSRKPMTEVNRAEYAQAKHPASPQRRASWRKTWHHSREPVARTSTRAPASAKEEEAEDRESGSGWGILSRIFPGGSSSRRTPPEQSSMPRGGVRALRRAYEAKSRSAQQANRGRR